MSDSADLHESTAQAQKPEVQSLRDRVHQTASSAKSAMSEAGEGVVDAIKTAMVSTDDFVRENPWIAVGVVAGIAGAVGFLAGLVAAPKKRYFWN